MLEQEQLVSFDTAVLAKEKGFDWKVTIHYRDGGMYNQELIYGGSPYNMNCSEEQKLWGTNLYSAPTQSLLQKWLRDEHNVYFNVAPQTFRGSTVYYKIEVAVPSMVWDEPLKCKGDTYEEALELGLQEALKLI